MELANLDLACTTFEKSLSTPQRLSVQHALENNIKALHCTTANIESSVGQAFKNVNKATIESAHITPTSSMSTYLILGLVAAGGIGLYFLYFRR